MEKTAHDIVLRPIITERSMAGVQARKYTFEVARTAGKIEIAGAVEKLFPGTKVQKVNTMHVRGRFKRQGRSQGYTSDWKKAVVTLTEASKGIEFFESMT
jgi:large subunit ribosomal protein L23